MKMMERLPMKRVLAAIVGAVFLTVPVMLAGTPASAETLEDVRKDEQRLLNLIKTDWNAILEEAKGQTVRWWFWNGDREFNAYVAEWVASRVKEKYDITLRFVPIKDTVEGVNQVVNEKNAGKVSGGSVDMQWISAENLKTMIQADLLFTGWAWSLPNSKYVDYDDPTIADQGGLIVGNNAQVWERYQYVFVYNADQVKEPGTTFRGILEWCKANPGKFTYPAPPDFTGRGQLTSLLYEISGGYKQWLGEFDQALWDKWSPKMWDFLNEMKECSWRKGETFPETVAAQDVLYASGELAWTHTAFFGLPARNVRKGTWPKGTRTMVIDIGTLSGTGSVSIPYNSSSKAAALVVADFLTSPEAQYEKSLPTGVGDGTILDLNKLPADWQKKFQYMPKLDATLPAEVLAAHSTPTATSYHIPIEKGWREHVLKSK